MYCCQRLTCTAEHTFLVFHDFQFFITDPSQPRIIETIGGNHTIYITWETDDTDTTHITFIVDYIVDGAQHNITTNETEAILNDLTPGAVYDISVTSLFKEKPSVATSTKGAPRKLM